MLGAAEGGVGAEELEAEDWMVVEASAEDGGVDLCDLVERFGSVDESGEIFRRRKVAVLGGGGGWRWSG